MTMYGLPSDVVYCKKCVISNQRPNSTVEFAAASGEVKKTIRINEAGVCDACVSNEEKQFDIDWASREQSLFELAEKTPLVNGYNCVVPGSGGKDSAFTAHILKYKYGFSPLTVTWAPHLYTEIGHENFTNWSHVGGLDNILYTPNGRLHRDLTRRAFINLVHPFQPFIVGQRIIGPKIASMFGLNLVFYGENQAEYGNPVEENKSPMMKADFYQAHAKEILLGGDTISSISEQSGFRLEDFAPYMPLSADRAKDVRVHYLGYYEKWDPQECFYYAMEHTGFQPNPERTEGTYSRYSSIDDKIDPFHYYTTLAKFGLGRASYDASQEIRTGKITRDEGIALVKQYDSEFPNKYFSDFLDYIGISEGLFHQTIDKARPGHLWKKTGESWTLKNPVWERV